MRMTTRKPRGAAALAALSLLAITLFLPAGAGAQWTPPDANNNVSNTNTGNVGVGTAAPATIFQIRPAVNINMGFTQTGGTAALISAFNDANTAPVPFILRGANIRFQDGTLTERFRLSSGVAVGSGYVGTAPPTDGAIFQGNIGLGTTSPGMLNGVNLSAFVPLHIQGAAGRYIVVDSATSNSGLALNDSSQAVDNRLWAVTQAAGGGKLTFSSVTDAGLNSHKMVIDRAGNVGVGTVAPSFRFEVAGTASRNTMALTGDGDAVGYAGLRIQALTTTGIATNRTAAFNLHMRKDGWYGGDGSGPSFVIETTSKSGGYAAPFLITPTNNVILNGGQGASGLAYGNVGVGMTNPAQKLDVAGNVNGTGLCIAGDCKTAWSQVAPPSQWTTSGSNLYYGGSGNLGLGTNAPAALIDGQRAETGDLLMRLWNTSAASGTTTFRIVNSSTAGSRIQFTDVSAYVSTIAADRVGGLRFRTGNAMSEAALGDRMAILPDGKVGVGTSSPASQLFVGGGTAAVQALPGLNVALGGSSYVSASNGQVNTFIGSDVSTYGIVGTLSNHPLGLRANNTLAVTVMPSGKVGIGKTNPTEALDVQGNITASGNIAAKFQDVAEWVPSTQKLRAGTVVVLDTGRSNHVLASTNAYDTGVAGVISESPGVILGEGGDGRLMVATTGRVRVKVDATRAPIKVGDLLVTSGVEGVAMKSVPVDFAGTPFHRPGTIIGKALEPLEKGVGEILVLLSLQ